MIRKIVLALAAVATLGSAALAPSAASAHWKGHGGGFGHGFHGGVRIIGGPAFVPVRCYWVEKFTPFGVRLVKVCNYY